MRRLLRLVCWIADHDWAPPIVIRDSTSPVIFRTFCCRCCFVIIGDRDWMEDNHAWDHFRGSR